MTEVRSRRLRRGQAVWRLVLDGAIVSTLHDGNTYWLDPVATTVWQLLETPMTETEIISELSVIYAAPAADVGRDLASVLDKLVADGAIDAD